MGNKSKIAHDTLRALRDAGIVNQNTPRQWRIVDPLLRAFLVELEHSR